MTNFTLNDRNFTLTDTEKIMIKIAYRDGQEIGRKLADAIKSGEFRIPDNETLKIFIGEFSTYDLLPSHKLLIKIFSPDSYRVGNFGFAGGGVMIMGSSAVNFCKAKNNVAKICYGISGICGGTAAIFGTYAGITSYYGLSKIAVGGDIFGGSFLWAGNKAQELGNFVEANNSWKPRNFVLRKPSTSKMKLGYKGIGFVLPRHVEVKFQTIIIIGGIAITIFSYAKIMIAIYRSLKKRLKPKIQIYTIARFLIDAFNQSESIKKRNRIYYYALRF